MRRLLAAAVLAAAFVPPAGSVTAGELMNGRMSYDIKGWSFLYKTSKGTGRIACANGQSANVRISAHGGGITFGTVEVIGGKGTFSGPGTSPSSSGPTWRPRPTPGPAPRRTPGR